MTATVVPLLAHVTQSYRHVSPPPHMVRLICKAVIIQSCGTLNGMAAALQVAA